MVAMEVDPGDRGSFGEEPSQMSKRGWAMPVNQVAPGAAMRVYVVQGDLVVAATESKF